MRAEILESERLLFERIFLGHLSQDYVNWMNDSEVFLYMESGGNYTKEMLQSYIEEQESKDILFWAIKIKATGKHIGNIKIDPVNPESNSGEYGILIGDKTEWGKGYAKEASLRIIAYCFEKLSFSQITLGVIEDNIKALELYKKMGFEIKTKLLNYGIYNNKVCNVIRMVLKNEKLGNKLILGTVQMGLAYGVNNSDGQISFKNSCVILSKTFELGIDTLDSAEAYGNAHQVIGDFHRLNPEIKFKVITKIPHNTIVEEIEEKIRTYIDDLNVKYLEVLMFHSFDSYEKNRQIIEVLEELKSMGLIRHIGVSIYTNDHIEALLLDDNITVVQMPFNLLDNESIRGDLMNKLREKGKIIHTRSAFLQGLFFKDISSDSDVVKKLANELIAIKNIANVENTSVSNLALSYCLNQVNIDQVLIGVDSVSQLIDNVKALNYKIDPQAISKINKLKVYDLDLLNPSLWK